MKTLDHHAVAQVFIDGRLKPTYGWCGCIATAIYVLGGNKLSNELIGIALIRNCILQYNESSLYVKGLAYDFEDHTQKDDPDYMQGKSDRMKILSLVHQAGVDIRNIAGDDYWAITQKGA